MIRLGVFFAYRIKDRKSPNPHERKETMGLPKGAMRTFLALTFTAIAALAVLGNGDFVVAMDKKWILGELGVIITFYFGSKAVEAYVDSRTKLAAIEKASDVDEAMSAHKDEDRPSQVPTGPIPE